MSKIDKLSILGVRSFDPVIRETIQFNSPLTLIVGYNGSGKTTIIECLKYATTGELPPNSKGGAFIHDPKLCGEKEIMAQVKLSFRSTAGESYVVTRSLQLTIQKAKRTQKTLEGTLLCRSNGERTSISARVNELDTVVPEKLGVSQAILDAVIFCHQDESLWPMSEPSVLKKRFDEIFEALRYTKAIENLKVLRKKHGDELGRLKISEGHDRDTKEKAEKSRKKMSALQVEIDELNAEAKTISEEMDETQQRSREKAELANGSLRYVQDLQNKSDQLDFRKAAVSELRETIDEMPETDDFLQGALSQYEDRVARLQEEADQSAENWKDLQNQLNSTRKSLSARLAEQGKHQSDKEKHERQLALRIGMIKDSANRHEIRGYDGDLDDDRVQSFYDRLNRILQDKKRELQRLQQENGRELERLGNEIQSLEGQKQSRTQDRLAAKRRMEAIDKETLRRNNSIAALDIDEGSRTIQESRLVELESTLAKAKDDANNPALDSELQQYNDNLTQMEAESERLGRELVECTRLASERAQIDIRRKELTDRKRELETRVNTWKEKLSAIVGPAWTPATVEADFQGVLGRQQADMADIGSHRETTQAELKQVEFKLATTRDKHKSTTAEEDQNRTAVLKALEGIESSAPIEDYLSELGYLEADMVTVDQDLKLFDHLKEYYMKCQKALSEKDCCLLCDRKFGSDQSSQRSKLMTKIMNNLGEKGKAAVQEEKALLERKLRVLRAVRTQYDIYQRAHSELPALDKEIKAIEVQKDSLVRRLEQQDAVYKEAEEKRQDIDSMSKTVAKISQLFKDIGDLETKIERSASQLQLSGPIRSVEDIHELQKATSDQIRVVNAKIKKLESDKRRMQDLASSLALEHNELRNQVLNLVRQLERKGELQEEIQQLRNDYSHQREIVQQADNDLEALEPEIAKAREIREDALQRGRSKESKVAEERDAVSSTLGELRMIESDIQAYIENGGPANLVSNQRSIKNLEQTIANIEKEAQDVTIQINKMKQEIANSDRKKKNIGDNLNYRRNLRALKDLELEIDALKQRNDQADYDRLIRDKNILDSHHNKLLAKRGTILGQINSKDEELAGLEQEWDLEFKGAAQKYRETHIKVETTKAAIEDLGRYSSALDKAIMQFHGLKMEEVNRIAGELWKSTYQGTDIDTILIRSDSESATGKRNYNYRVCMVKQDTEMDMRGRCSAGQKVLASIIIRLALAESFGINCGLIALDEPTTNLDSDNIRSLAESLHRIIKARQAQSNFQLIVITHDEEFLKHMQCSDFCDNFYRVRRDEKQNSIIRGESITNVME